MRHFLWLGKLCDRAIIRTVHETFVQNTSIKSLSFSSLGFVSDWNTYSSCSKFCRHLFYIVGIFFLRFSFRNFVRHFWLVHSGFSAVVLMQLRFAFIILVSGLYSFHSMASSKPFVTYALASWVSTFLPLMLYNYASFSRNLWKFHFLYSYSILILEVKRQTNSLCAPFIVSFEKLNVLLSMLTFQIVFAIISSEFLDYYWVKWWKIVHRISLRCYTICCVNVSIYKFYWSGIYKFSSADHFLHLFS